MIKCVAIDDEPIALSIIREYCNRIGEVDLQTFTSPVLGMECVKSTHPDIVFLDIEMNSHNGVALAKELPYGTCLIFTTAYASYAIDGFNVDAVDFLHKPIFYPRFERAMEKAKKYLGIPNPGTSNSSFTLKVEHKNVVIKFKDILFIEAMDNYVKVYRDALPTVVSQITMKEIENLLPTSSFLRVHRSFIVSISHIEKFSNKTIYLNDHQYIIPVGRKYIDNFNNLNNIINQ